MVHQREKWIAELSLEAVRPRRGNEGKTKSQRCAVDEAVADPPAQGQRQKDQYGKSGYCVNGVGQLQPGSEAEQEAGANDSRDAPWAHLESEQYPARQH